MAAVIAALLPLLCGGTALAADAKTTFEIYGFAQADAIYDVDRLDPDWDDAFRPSKIPTVPGLYGSNGQSSLSVKQSRFGVKGTMPTGASSQPLNFKFEFDLFGTGADAGQTTFRLRHAYGEWGQWLAGQTNSLFMDGDVFPNTIDYWGPAGMVFYRNVQIRYTPYRAGGTTFALAIERPGNDIDVGRIRQFDPALGDRIQNDEALPDLTLQWRTEGDWGHLQVAGILRRVGAEITPAPLPAPQSVQTVSDTGYGVNVGSHFNVLQGSAVRLQLVYGEGIASYMNDGGTDLAPAVAPGSAALRAEAVETIGLVAYYDHRWNQRFTSSIGYSFNDQKNTNFQSGTAMDKLQYASANLLYTPAENLLTGIELLWGDRQDKSGASGSASRVQVTIKYNFGTSL
jgi:hypothetical protein